MLRQPSGRCLPDFDAQGFLDAAKRNFVTLQAAWDKGDIATLRAMMTDDMLAEIKQQLEEREAQSAGAPNQIDVVMIDGHLLGIEDLGRCLHGQCGILGPDREEPWAGLSPFREVWNMAKPKRQQRLVGGRFTSLRLKQSCSTSGIIRGLWQHSPPFLSWTV